MTKAKIPIILGPTASGKSKLAIKKARELGAQVISADAFQVYHDFNIGTGTLTNDEMNGVPHHLLNHVHPESPYSVQQFIEDTENITQKIDSPLIICGGAAMYLKALIYGYHPLKRLPLDQRPEGSNQYLWHQLHEIDPELALKTPYQNRSRVQRYLELHTIYKTKPSALFKSRPVYKSPYLILGLLIEPRQLKDAIDRRINTMLQRGLIEEVQMLLKTYSPASPAFRSIGYKEVLQYLQHAINKDTMVEMIKKNTYQYAKRQMTWFKRFDHVHWIPATDI